MITVQRSKSNISMGKPTTVIVNGLRVGGIAAGYALKLNLKKGDTLQLTQGLLNRSAKMIINNTDAHYKVIPNPKSAGLIAVMIAALLLIPPMIKSYVPFSQNVSAIIIFLIFLFIELIFNFRSGLLIEEI
ncbi:hypothetical protein JF75_00470 [Lactobacillus kimbladii]|uniref:Uncharacterized protein n=1 Tax=Lactobacillus kimbladii TaxID=1218506 RepID=A0A0F4LMX8_9LACO|nr:MULTISPECIES: hypothetical protein [Lactobacillus]KJY59930.1 hypothetical protein JF75_00470 [Lactobacillus kimbladii]MCO6557815.1 hypothetical protein [Gilliamella sp.]RMC57362.1 hypothetical protein F5ESL0261_00165 [Lactobacillus sp. ESL0261]